MEKDDLLTEYDYFYMSKLGKTPFVLEVKRWKLFKDFALKGIYTYIQPVYGLNHVFYTKPVAYIKINTIFGYIKTKTYKTIHGDFLAPDFD